MSLVVHPLMSPAGSKGYSSTAVTQVALVKLNTKSRMMELEKETNLTEFGRR